MSFDNFLLAFSHSVDTKEREVVSSKTRDKIFLSPVLSMFHSVTFVANTIILVIAIFPSNLFSHLFENELKWNFDQTKKSK